MKSIINYYDDNLAGLIKEKLGNKYGDFQPIIIDVLLRRKYAFHYSNEQCLKEVDRFIDNCEFIAFKELKNAGGYAYYFERKIEINSKIRDIAYLYGTIAHEISHILSYHFIENNENGERIEHNMSKENLRKYEGKAHIGGRC